MEKGLRGPSLPLSRSIRSSVINLVEKTLARTHTQTHTCTCSRVLRGGLRLTSALSSSRLSRSARTSVLSRRHSRDGKEKDGRVIEGTREGDAGKGNLSSSSSLSLVGVALLRSTFFPLRAVLVARRDEVGMIYARHAEASVTVCLMHWSSLDPLLPPLSSRRPLTLRAILPPVVPRLSPPHLHTIPTLSSSSTAVKAARSRGNRVHPRAHKSGAR